MVIVEDFVEKVSTTTANRGNRRRFCVSIQISSFFFLFSTIFCNLSFFFLIHFFIFIFSLFHVFHVFHFFIFCSFFDFFCFLFDFSFWPQGRRLQEGKEGREPAKRRRAESSTAPQEEGGKQHHPKEEEGGMQHHQKEGEASSPKEVPVQFIVIKNSLVLLM